VSIRAYNAIRADGSPILMHGLHLREPRDFAPGTVHEDEHGLWVHLKLDWIAYTVNRFSRGEQCRANRG
jgi:hypothetical protein